MKLGVESAVLVGIPVFTVPVFNMYMDVMSEIKNK